MSSEQTLSGWEDELEEATRLVGEAEEELHNLQMRKRSAQSTVAYLKGQGTEDRERFYLINNHGGPVGNCALFWNKDGKGYGCDPDNAHEFTEEEADGIIKMDPSKFTKVSAEFVQANTRRVFDVQNLIKLRREGE